jgi:hypothetical protein
MFRTTMSEFLHSLAVVLQFVETEGASASLHCWKPTLATDRFSYARALGTLPLVKRLAVKTQKSHDYTMALTSPSDGFRI